MFSSLNRLFKRLFKHRKILIISDKHILSIPFSPATQMCIVLVAMTATAWFSYTSGKNSLYKEALSEKNRTLHEKEKEITIKTLANKDLLSQVTDLHKDLQRLNTYFESLSGYDERRHNPKNTSKETSDAAPSSQNNTFSELEGKPVVDPQDVARVRKTAQATLNNINQNIVERIKELESVITSTGITLSAVTKPELVPDDLAEMHTENDDAQGGPFIAEGDSEEDLLSEQPVSLLNEHMDSHIGYLLHLEEVINAMPLTYPIKNARITSRFGTRSDPIRHRNATHYGLDFAGAYHANVMATAPGVVKKAGYYGAYGRFVEIDHGHGISTRYGHMYKVTVKKGQKIAAGQTIGIQGNTGRSTGAHLHYEIRYNGKPYNPEKFLKAGRYVFEERKS